MRSAQLLQHAFDRDGPDRFRLDPAWAAQAALGTDVLPPPELPLLRAQVNDALLDLVYVDPLSAWEGIPVLELSGPLDGRLDAVLAALGIASGQ
jgi:hypothetical protein